MVAKDSRGRRNTLISGWGHTHIRAGHVLENCSSVRAVMERVGERGVIPRGLGRSYGDSSVNGGGDHLLGNGGVHLDADTGIVVCGGGASIHDVYRRVVPHGWMMPVTAGTQWITVGGAIASDIHGKNHHGAGTLSRHLLSFELVDGSGNHHHVTQGTPIFDATCGGMGLTGMITSAEIQLRSIPSGYIDVTTRRKSTLTSVLDAMLDDDEEEYSVAWIDLAHRQGRGIIETGTWSGTAAKGLVGPRKSRLAVPSIPRNVVRPETTRIFNSLWWMKASDGVSLRRYDAYFHPLDGVSAWYNLYGAAGFIQYQFVVPDRSIDVVERIAYDVVRQRLGTPLVVLKRFGDEGPGYLSFPLRGWTLAIDIAAGQPALLETLRRWDEWVIDAGGRVYLTKDSHMDRPTLVAMYPRLTQFEDVQRTLDPHGRLSSDQSRRLLLGESSRSRRGLS